MKGLPIVLMIVIVSLLVFPIGSHALQQIAGKLSLEVSAGESGTIRYGLINDKKETVTVSLRAEGPVSEFLSFPSKVQLEPGILSFVNITSSVPKDYSGHETIEGFLYALEESEGGQIQLQVQMKKQVELTIPRSKVKEPTITGFITAESQSVLLGIIALVFLAVLAAIIRKRR